MSRPPLVEVPRTIVVTGASDGIGAAAARKLADLGHRVIVVGRNPAKTRFVATAIGAPHFTADFSSLDEVRDLAASLAEIAPRIDVLANNAGGVFGPERTVTDDGNELTLQVNHLAPFLLTELLADNLAAGLGYVVGTASIAAKLYGDLDVNDLDNADGPWDPMKAYGDSKMMNIIHARELSRRHADRGIYGASFHPGVIASNFGAGAGPLLEFLYTNPVTRMALGSTDKGAARLVRLATGTVGTDFVPGGYYLGKKRGPDYPGSRDQEIARRLWEESARRVGL
ncbi:SDR family NAD(P)-dependent oxidoreductase [Corynebacterium pygosceleis]|uniref:SDR family NAD(P)-dependent oxidoreductase n=1 Tax=Corynebacterium pygosceleis TaxID=2800406 RepID=UPI002004407B|nr:SDR family NAD(P)-dependent oxidoreductase [Corynebacterium pygosceleis]MCK7675921.1 SDR family NAD(P)-dependent oxidoreductase [Corynebacterium pygosceleis]